MINQMYCVALDQIIILVINIRHKVIQFKEQHELNYTSL